MVAAPTTAARRVTKGSSGRSPAATTSRIIAKMRGLAAMPQGEQDQRCHVPSCTLRLWQLVNQKNCVTGHIEDVVDMDTKALAKENTFCLWVLTQLDSFVCGPNDICLGQELVGDELPKSNSDPERVASGCRTSSIFHSGRAAFRSSTY